MPDPLPFLDPLPERPQPLETQVCDGCSKPAMHLTARGDQWLCVSCRVKNPMSMAEEFARAKKAAAIAEILWWAFDGDLSKLSAMNADKWTLAAKAAQVKPPSLQTRELVRDLLERRAAVQHG